MTAATTKVRPTATSNASTVRSAFGLACHSSHAQRRPDDHAAPRMTLEYGPHPSPDRAGERGSPSRQRGEQVDAVAVRIEDGRVAHPPVRSNRLEVPHDTPHRLRSARSVVVDVGRRVIAGDVRHPSRWPLQTMARAQRGIRTRRHGSRRRRSQADHADHRARRGFDMGLDRRQLAPRKSSNTSRAPGRKQAQRAISATTIPMRSSRAVMASA